jgi:ubiquinone/menaquinone biosynthesis C-methylase UbiE
MNHFTPKSAAERYAKGRPYFHPNTIQHIKEFLRLNGKVDRALDIACGTGLSTKALLEIATSVYGTDASPEMLHLAPLAEKIHYSVALAEQQPFGDSYFNMITVGSGVHWFDIDRFLQEAYRLLKSKSWLVLYENHFISEMMGNESFKDWFPTVYLKKYPSPPRNDKYEWTNENLVKKNFNLVAEEKFKNPIVFNKHQLISYFTTQSNIISAVEKGATTYEAAGQWLSDELSVFFGNDETEQTINYGNWIKYIQRVD